MKYQAYALFLELELDLRPHPLNWVELRAVGDQIDYYDLILPNKLFDLLAVVDSAVVHHDGKFFGL